MPCHSLPFLNKNHHPWPQSLILEEVYLSRANYYSGGEHQGSANYDL